MNFYKTFAAPALFNVDAEASHKLTIKGLKISQKIGIGSSSANCHSSDIGVKIAGLKFPNPVGIAAGFDKNGEVSDAILQMGFGFAEIGTVTPRPQNGNPKPRIFRLIEDEAVINRLGFNNQGHDVALANLQSRRQTGIVGVNIGANKDSEDFVSDYELGIAKFWGQADYFTANISSPNTPGLRNLQARDALMNLLTRLQNVREKLARTSEKIPPLFLKVAPDLDDKAIKEISQCVVDCAIDGIIVSNTTLSRAGISSPSAEAGGLSGQPLHHLSTIVLAKIREQVGETFPIIGVGGIDSAQTAWEKFEAGANLVQLYTGLIYQGPGLPAKICRGLSDKLKNTNHTNIAAVTNSKTNNWAALPLKPES